MHNANNFIQPTQSSFTLDSSYAEGKYKDNLLAYYNGKLALAVAFPSFDFQIGEIDKGLSIWLWVGRGIAIVYCRKVKKKDELDDINFLREILD